MSISLYSTDTAAKNKTWGWAGLTNLGLAASCRQRCTSGPNTMENTAVPGERGEELLQQVQREHVVCEEWSQRSAVQCSADWVWPGCHAPCSKLARVETI